MITLDGDVTLVITLDGDVTLVMITGLHWTEMDDDIGRRRDTGDYVGRRCGTGDYIGRRLTLMITLDGDVTLDGDYIGHWTEM